MRRRIMCSLFFLVLGLLWGACVREFRPPQTATPAVPLAELAMPYVVRDATLDEMLCHALRARGMDLDLAPVLRRLWNDESGCQHFQRDGRVIVSEPRGGRVMVGLGQINMAPGARCYGPWDVYTLDGNVQASVAIFAAKLAAARGDVREAIARYQGYRNPRSARARAKAKKILGGSQ